MRIETSTPVPDPLVTATPERMGGEPVFAGTRVPVQTLFDYIQAGDPLDAFLLDFPDVSREHTIAVLEFARKAAISVPIVAADIQQWGPKAQSAIPRAQGS